MLRFPFLVIVMLGGCSRSATDGQPLGPFGGVRERDGARVDVPAGALMTEQLISVTSAFGFPVPPAGTKFSNGIFEFTPHGQKFEGVVHVRVPASAGQVLMTADPNGAWRVVEGAVFADGGLTAAVRHFSFFAAATPGARVDRIFFSDGAALRSMNPDGGSLTTLVPGVLFDQYLTGVAIDPAARHVYWTDNVTDRLSRVDYDGTAATVLYTSADKLANPTGLAVDPSHGSLFWAEGANVRSCRLDGTGVTTVVAGQANHQPSSVALDPASQRIYWTDIGTDAIRRADYNGANSTAIYSALDSKANPRGLAVDVANNKLFWAEDLAIRSSALDGSQVTTIVAGVVGMNAPDAIALDPVRRLLYWTDNGTDAVHVAGYSGTPARVLFQNPDKFSNPQGIAIDFGN